METYCYALGKNDENNFCNGKSERSNIFSLQTYFLFLLLLLTLAVHFFGTSTIEMSQPDEASNAPENNTCLTT